MARTPWRVRKVSGRQPSFILETANVRVKKEIERARMRYQPLSLCLCFVLEVTGPPHNASMCSHESTERGHCRWWLIYPQFDTTCLAVIIEGVCSIMTIFLIRNQWLNSVRSWSVYEGIFYFHPGYPMVSCGAILPPMHRHWKATVTKRVPVLDTKHMNIIWKKTSSSDSVPASVIGDSSGLIDREHLLASGILICKLGLSRVDLR